jgi:C1A family cysteine protease
MNNKAIWLAALILVLVAVLAGWVFKSSPQTLGSQLSVASPVLLMDARHVLLASRTVLLDDPLPELQSRNLPLPTLVNLWTRRGAELISVDDQGPFGSCTACAMRYAWRLWRNRLDPFRIPIAPSRLFWYAMSRLDIGEKLSLDRGSTNAATARILRTKGMVPEASWPYTRENVVRKPLPVVEHSALANRTSQPTALRFFQTAANTIQSMRQALAQGKAIVIAVLVYSSFMSASTVSSGKIPMPNTARERLLGGHAITLTGYDFGRAVFTFRNSWGTRVGMGGHFEIPFAYVANPRLAGDAWIV